MDVSAKPRQYGFRQWEAISNIILWNMGTLPQVIDKAWTPTFEDQIVLVLWTVSIIPSKCGVDKVPANYGRGSELNQQHNVCDDRTKHLQIQVGLLFKH